MPASPFGSAWEARVQGHDHGEATRQKVYVDARTGKVVHTIRQCSVYEVRPLQCRTWPFWPENLWSKKTWDHAAKRCHGMNAGHRHFTLDQIAAAGITPGTYALADGSGMSRKIRINPQRHPVLEWRWRVPARARA